MKTNKILSILTLLFTLSQLSFAQDITADTIFANNYFEKAGIFQDSLQYDSAMVYFKKASALYHAHDQWRHYLHSETKHGVCYMEQWQLDLAIATIKSAIKHSLLHINENDTTVANAYFGLGNSYYYQSKNDSAISYLEKALKIYEERLGEKHTDVAQTYMNLGNVHINKNEYDLGLEYYFKSLEIAKELHGEMHISVARNYNNIGTVYHIKDELDLALQYYFKSNEILKELLGEKHINVATSYMNIGNIYTKKDEYDLALQYQLKSLEIKEELLGEKHTVVAASYNNIGIVYEYQNEYDLALQYHFKSLEIKKELFGERHNSVATSYGNIGITYSRKKEYDLALQYHFKALQIRKELHGEKHSSVASSYNSIGIVYKAKNEYDLALQYFFMSFDIYRELLGEKHTLVAQSYMNIGNIYYEKKEYDLALQYHLKSLEIKKELLGEKHTVIASSYTNFGLVYYERNELDSALQCFLKALEINKELLGEKHTSVARSYMGIGNVYSQKDNYGLTLHNFQKGIASSLLSFNDTVDVYSVPLIRDYLNSDVLLELLHTKAEIFVNLWTVSESGSILDSLQPRPPPALIKRDRIDYLKSALRHYQACDTLINQVRQSIITKSDKIALGEKASEVYRGAVNVCINLAASSSPRHTRRGFDSISYYNEQAFYFSEKNKSSVLLEALAGAEAQEFAGIPDTLLKKENKLQIDIALYERVLAEQPDSAKETLFRDKLFNANRQYDELIALFESQYSDYFELKYNREPAGVKDIQGLLDNETAIINYVTGDSMITIFTITTNKLDVITVPAIENLAFTIGVFRYGLLYPNSSMSAEDYKGYAFRIYKQLIPENIPEGIKNLIIIPDAELCMIPFETLLTENPGDKAWKELPYLIKKYNFSYSYSANLFFKTLPKEPPTDIEFTDLNDWLAIAPVFDDLNTAGLSMRTRELLEQLDSESADTTGSRGTLIKGGYISPLPETESEVRSIFKQFDEKGKKALVQIKNNANEEFIKSGTLKNYRLLHFATHGFVNTSKPELSGILLAQDTTLSEDGVLYSGEIFNLDLNADLTVLSACETGLGKLIEGEGLIGLTRALLYAGTKNIIVSLWKVADKSTSDLMIDFYKNLLEPEQEKQEFSHALHQAKLKMIDEGLYAHPFYWSPFILIGK